MAGNIQIGQRVLVQQAWEDESGAYHDAFAEVIAMNGRDRYILKFEEPKVEDFLYGCDYGEDEIEAV